MTVEDGEVSFHYAILDPQIWPRRQDADLTLGLIAGLVRRFCGPEPVPLALGFEHARGPDSAALSARVRHEVAHAEETNRIAFPARLLDATGEGRGTADFATVSRELDRVARDRHRTQTLRTRVKQAVLEDMGHGPVDQTRIARALGLSRRSLRRRLEANGDSFRHLVDECRQSCALAYLTRTDWPISAIAFRLGYSDQTAFSRAFSRWYGRSPRAVRMDARERGVSGRCP
jgi:AraC-like DNA-binding protein